MKNHRSKLAELMVVFLCKREFLIILKILRRAVVLKKNILPKVAQDSQLMSYDHDDFLDAYGYT